MARGAVVAFAHRSRQATSGPIRLLEPRTASARRRSGTDISVSETADRLTRGILAFGEAPPWRHLRRKGLDHRARRYMSHQGRYARTDKTTIVARGWRVFRIPG
jgi:hypothetical protein